MTPAPQRGFHRTHLRPSTGPIAVDLRRLGIQVQSATKTGSRVGCEQQRREPIAAQDGDRVVRGIADVPLGVDRQPRLTLSRQDIRIMEVSVHERLGLIRT